MLPDEVGRILGIELEVARPGARSSRTRCSRPSGQIGEASEMGGSGVRRASSALFGFEQTVGIDLSLERRHEGRSGSLCRLARVVGRVESVCTDSSAKGPTGPFCLVHSVMLPVSPAAFAAFLARPHRVRAPALLGQPSARSIAEPLFWSSLRLLLAAPGAEFRRRSENGPTLRPHQPATQAIVYKVVYSSHRTGNRFNLVHKLPCPARRTGVR